MVATLDVNTIGGLNKRAARSNPDKGQLIECINCGNIEAYVSVQGIAEDRFVIIPTDRTMFTKCISFLRRRKRKKGCTGRSDRTETRRNGADLE